MKKIFIVLGAITLGLGIIGVFLPVLPTTPFLLLTAGLWMRGSTRLYEWLMASRFGPYIRNFREHKAITVSTKVVILTTMWATMSLSAFLAIDAWWIRGVLFAVAVGVTWHILSFKTLRRPPETF